MTTVPERWRKSTRSSTNTNCVELSNAGEVRDSKNPNGARLTGGIGSLLASVKTGRFDER